MCILSFLCDFHVAIYCVVKVLFRFALAFLKYAEEEILTLKEAHHIYRYMRMLGEKITNGRRIAQVCTAGGSDLVEK